MMTKQAAGIHICKHSCKDLYIYNVLLAPGVTSNVTFHFRCAICGAEHLGQLDEDFILHCLRRKGMANNDLPMSCPL